MDSALIPETAIAAFERLNGLRVTVHDLEGTLWPTLAPDRTIHAHSLCQAIKSLGRQPRCFAWEITDLRPQLDHLPHGRIQVCHAGLVEWVVPVYGRGRLLLVLFAGPRTAGPDLEAASDRLEALPAEMNRTSHLPPPVGREEAEMILENLRQLAARLALWHQELPPVRRGGLRTSPEPPGEIALRRTAILRFVTARHLEPVSLQDLATHLALGPSRTSHAVRECCGATFPQLITTARLRSARGLLRHTALGVEEVAIRCGFASTRHFFRAFQEKHGTTPLQYRKQGVGTVRGFIGDG